MGKGRRRRKKKDRLEESSTPLPEAESSEVPPVASQKDHASTQKDNPVDHKQQRKLDALSTNGMTLPAANEIGKTAEATEHPEDTSTDHALAKPTPRDQKRRHDRCMLFANCIMAGAAVAAVIVASCQWSAMRSQLDAMNEQGKIMSGQLEQMKADSESSSRAMSDQLKHAIESSQSDSIAWNRQLGIMEGQLSEMRSATHLEQRAWVGCRNGKCQPLVAGEKVSLELVYHNSGATPANKVKIGCQLLVEKKDYDIESYAMPRKEVAKTEITTEKTIAPNVTQTAPHRGSIEGLTDDVIGRIKSGDLVIYVLGEIVYDDIFEQRHLTMYCCVVDPSTWQLRVYRQYNRMD